MAAVVNEDWGWMGAAVRTRKARSEALIQTRTQGGLLKGRSGEKH